MSALVLALKIPSTVNERYPCSRQLAIHVLSVVDSLTQ